MEWIWFVLGAVGGALVQFVLETPWEEYVERRFQKIIGIGIYRQAFMQAMSFEELEKRLKGAIKNYEFEYCRNLIDRMELFIEEKSEQEKKKAYKEALLDYETDKKRIRDFKGNKRPSQYNEKRNQWIKKSHPSA